MNVYKIGQKIRKFLHLDVIKNMSYIILLSRVNFVASLFQGILGKENRKLNMSKNFDIGIVETVFFIILSMSAICGIFLGSFKFSFWIIIVYLFMLFLFCGIYVFLGLDK